MLDDPLVYGHLVLEGIVSELSPKRIAYRDWIGPDELALKGDVNLCHVRLSAVRVLKGVHPDPEIVIWTAIRNVQGLSVTDTVFVSLFLHPEVSNGVYVLHNRHGLFRKEGALWRYQHDRSRTVTPEEIEDRVSKGRLEHVIRVADLVVTGTVLAVEDSSITKNGQSAGVISKYMVAIDSTLKGTFSGNRLTFFTATRGHRPEWITFSVDTPGPGERWYLFLKAADPGYVPCCGANGMFRIEKGRLFHYCYVPYNLTKEALDQRVEAEMARDE